MLADYWNDIAASFLDSSKRVFFGYLLSAFIIALLWLVFKKKYSLVSALNSVFAKKNWWSNSAKADYKLFLMNKAFLLLFSPLLISQVALATIIFYWLHKVLPESSDIFVGFSDASVAVVFTLSYFLLDDFTRFYVHRLMHRWPLLWAFHKVHHSAETMTPMTVFRTHPVESVLFSIRSTLTQAVAIGGFVYFMGDRADLITVLGASVFIFLFNILGSNLRHSHVSIYYWRPLEKIIISPAQHQIHHSVERAHWNKNYGVVLAIWDVLFRSHHFSEKDKALSFGLSEPETIMNEHGLVSALNYQRKDSLYSLVFKPFGEAAGIIIKNINGSVAKLRSRGTVFKKTI